MKPITEFLSTKVAKPSIIKATNKTIHQIVKDELDRLGHDASLNHIDVSKVTSMYNLFSCNGFGYLRNKTGDTSYGDLNPDITSWNVSKVENMYCMFSNCKNFNQDISGWDVSNVEDMGAMFEYCEKFNQDISGWNISKVRSLDTMFYNCKEFNQDLSTWDVSNVASMQSMFEGCRNFNQDLSGWDVSKVRMYYDMFKYCPIKEEYMPKFN